MTNKIAKKIQEKEILFGISIDGDKLNHDKNRILLNDKTTFDIVYKNAISIDDKTLVGIAITLEFGEYDLYNYFDLFKDFNTISIKPVRKDYSNKTKISDVKKMINSYINFTNKLINDIHNSYLDNLFKLLNGDDYFGRYISRIVHHDIILERCDAGKSRVALKGKEEYICTSSVFNDNLLIKNFVKKTPTYCESCYIKNICGGECYLLMDEKSKNLGMCKLKEIFFYNAVKIYHELFVTNQFDKVYNFIEKKNQRFKLNKELQNLVELHRGILKFTEIKRLYDKNGGINHEKK